MVSRKLLQWCWMWKPSRSFPSSPSRSSSAQGKIRKASLFGHGMCQNWITFKSGRASLSMRGSSAR